nr:proteoglycan 4-like [Arachis hypogaea]
MVSTKEIHECTVQLRGKQILVTEKAIEEILQLLPKSDQPDGYQKVEEDMQFMRFDWDTGKQRIIIDPTVPWVMGKSTLGRRAEVPWEIANEKPTAADCKKIIPHSRKFQALGYRPPFLTDSAEATTSSAAPSAPCAPATTTTPSPAPDDIPSESDIPSEPSDEEAEDHEEDARAEAEQAGPEQAALHNEEPHQIQPADPEVTPPISPQRDLGCSVGPPPAQSQNQTHPPNSNHYTNRPLTRNTTSEPPTPATPRLPKVEREPPTGVAPGTPPPPKRKQKAAGKTRLSRGDEMTQSSTPEARKRTPRGEIMRTGKRGPGGHGDP